MHVGVTKLKNALSPGDIVTIDRSKVTAINTLATIPRRVGMFYLLQVTAPLNYPDPYVQACVPQITDPHGWYEVHCYPNVDTNGWGWAWENGAMFSAWWATVITKLKNLFPHALFGYPKLQPGMEIGSVRGNSNVFLEQSQQALDVSDFISEHVEWRGNTKNDLGIYIATWRMSFLAQTYGKPILVRFSNSNNSISKRTKGLQYCKFYQLMRCNPLVVAAFSHTLSSSDPADLWITWRSAKRESPIPDIVSKESKSSL